MFLKLLKTDKGVHDLEISLLYLVIKQQQQNVSHYLLQLRWLSK